MHGNTTAEIRNESQSIINSVIISTIVVIMKILCFFAKMLHRQTNIVILTNV